MSKIKPMVPDSRSAPMELNLQENYRSWWGREPKGPIGKPNGSVASFGEPADPATGEKIFPRRDTRP